MCLTGYERHTGCTHTQTDTHIYKFIVGGKLKTGHIGRTPMEVKTIKKRKAKMKFHLCIRRQPFWLIFICSFSAARFIHIFVRVAVYIIVFFPNSYCMSYVPFKGRKQNIYFKRKVKSWETSPYGFHVHEAITFAIVFNKTFALIKRLCLCTMRFCWMYSSANSHWKFSWVLSSEIFHLSLFEHIFVSVFDKIGFDCLWKITKLCQYWMKCLAGKKKLLLKLSENAEMAWK